jgi:hypothetical protein
MICCPAAAITIAAGHFCGAGLFAMCRQNLIDALPWFIQIPK